jgi:peptide/nickel transport system substrate-binding protein
MRRLFCVLSILVVLGMILAACAPTEAPPTVAPTEPPPEPTEAPEATVPPEPTEAPEPTMPPEEAECLKVGLSMASGEANSLDTINVPASEQAVMLNMVYQQLMELDSDFVVHPQLAESWEPNEDATEWTFHLREGVKFHDGKEFTADDVVWTYQRLIDPDVGSEAASTLAFLKPEGIVAVDDSTVKFMTDEPVPELPLLITTKNTWIVPDGWTSEELQLGGVGTGPFIPVDFEPVQQPHKFVKNSDYWEAGLPKSECVEFFVIQEPTTRVAAIQSGEVDIVEAVDFATVPSLEGDQNVVLLETPASQSLTLSFWTDTPPFDDVRVRQALKKLVDRQAILDTALLGYGDIGDDNPIPPSSPFAWRSEVPPRDVEGAIELLAEAGYGPDNPLTFDLYTADAFPGMLSMAQLFKEQAAEAGVEVNIITSPPAEYWDEAWMKQPAAGSSWVMRHPGEGLAIAYRSNTPYNETHWFRDDFDAILDEANTTADADARAELYQNAEQLLTEEGGVIIPVFMHMVAATASDCTGYDRHVRVDRFDLRNAYCGEGVEPPPPEPTEAPEPTEEPEAAAPSEEAECLKVGLSIGSGETNSLDPFAVPTTEQAVMINQVYNRLMDLDSDFVVQPELAESWESNEDATEWTFHLREGIKFHDGKEFTADDVVWTYQRLIDPDNPSEAFSTLSFLTPEGIVAVDDYTVKFMTAESVPELPVLITTKNTWIVPDGWTSEELRLGGVGTGPFIPVDFEPVQQPHNFVKNPDYWEAGLPKSECVEFYVIQEPTTRIASIQSGEVDIVEYVDFATIPTLEADPDVELLTTGPSTSLTFAMWVDTPPFDDPDVRQAIKKLVDRQQMVDTVFLGYAFVGDDNPIWPTSPYAWRAEVPPRDVEGAIELLAEAGYGPDNPLELDLYTADFMPGVVAAAQLFAEQAAEAGVEVNVIVGPPADHWDNVWLKQPFLNSGWDPRHPGEGLAIAYRSDALYDESHWYREDYDAILDEANTTVDPEARAELYQQAAQMLTEEGGELIPVFTRGVAAMRANCEGYERHVKSSRFDMRYAYCER